MVWNTIEMLKKTKNHIVKSNTVNCVYFYIINIINNNKHNMQYMQDIRVLIENFKNINYIVKNLHILHITAIHIDFG